MFWSYLCYLISLLCSLLFALVSLFSFLFSFSSLHCSSLRIYLILLSSSHSLSLSFSSLSSILPTRCTSSTRSSTRTLPRSVDTTATLIPAATLTSTGKKESQRRVRNRKAREWDTRLRDTDGEIERRHTETLIFYSLFSYLVWFFLLYLSSLLLLSVSAELDRSR